MSKSGLLFLGVVAVGCGPVQSSTLIVDAQAELAAAQTAGGDRAAIFEYTAAEEYLHKAREEQSYADYEVSVKFAKKSRDCARKARLIAERTTRSGMGMTADMPELKVRCRPGPERDGVALDPSEEAAAQPLPAEPADPKPAPAKKVAPAVQQPVPPAKKVAPIKPKDEPADPPEGDADEEATPEIDSKPGKK